MRHRPLWILCALLTASSVHAYSNIKLPTRLAWGVAEHDGTLWVTDAKAARLLSIDDAGRVTCEIATGGQGSDSWPRGLCAVGDLLALADAARRQIAFVNPQQRSIVRSFPAPGPDPQGLTYDEKAGLLWCADGERRLLYSLNAETGKVVKEVPAPSLYPRGMTLASGKLWVVDASDLCAYRLDPGTGTVEASVALPPHWPCGIIAREGLFRVILADSNMLVDAEYMERDGCMLSLPIDALVTMQCTVTTRYTRDAPTGAKLYAAVPPSTIRQDTRNITFFPREVTEERDGYGQAAAVWSIPAIRSGEKFTCGWKARVRLWSARYNLLPSSTTSVQVDPAYLRADRYITTEAPLIRSLEAGLEGLPILDKLLQVRNRIFDRMSYASEGGLDSADEVLQRGTGSCSEYSFVFAAAARGMGIPVRLAGGTFLPSSRPEAAPTSRRVDTIGHRWPEVYLEGYGWLPVDANQDDVTDAPYRRRGFLALPSTTLACVRGPLGEGCIVGTSYRARLQRPSGPSYWRHSILHVWELDELTPWTR